jgi:hypothetical protein
MLHLGSLVLMLSRRRGRRGARIMLVIFLRPGAQRGQDNEQSNDQGSNDKPDSHDPHSVRQR